MDLLETYSSYNTEIQLHVFVCQFFVSTGGNVRDYYLLCMNLQVGLFGIFMHKKLCIA